MKTRQVILWGCGSLLVLGAIVAIAAFFLVNHLLQDPHGLTLSVNGPKDVAVGQTFDLEVVVTNERKDMPLKLSDVDLGEEYLAGFTISSISPKPKSNQHVPIDNTRSFTFDVKIPAGESRHFVFTLRAEKAGIYRGDVDACEGLRFVTGLAETVVSEKSAPTDSP